MAATTNPNDCCVCYSTLDILPTPEVEEAIAHDFTCEETPEKKKRVLAHLCSETKEELDACARGVSDELMEQLREELDEN